MSQGRYEQRNAAIKHYHNTGDVIPLIQYHIDWPTSYFPQWIKRVVLAKLKEKSIGSE